MAALQPCDMVLTRGGMHRVVAVAGCAEAVPVYNMSVEGLKSYAVGETGVLVHNGDAEDYNGIAAASKKAVATQPEKPKAKVADATATPQKTTVGSGSPKAKTVPVSGATKPVTEANPTREAARAFQRKPRLPKQDGKWLNADGLPGTPGNSLWHSSKKGVPPIEFKGGYPVFQPVEGVQVKIKMTGVRTDPETDFRRAREAFGEQLRGNADLQKRLGIKLSDFLENGEVNTAALKRWIDKKGLTFHHHQDMQTMQLVTKKIHDAAEHTGGQSYAASVTRELMKRGHMTNKREGLTAELIQKAKELRIIPPTFDW